MLVVVWDIISQGWAELKVFRVSLLSLNLLQTF